MPEPLHGSGPDSRDFIFAAEAETLLNFGVQAFEIRSENLLIDRGHDYFSGLVRRQKRVW